MVKFYVDYLVKMTLELNWYLNFDVNISIATKNVFPKKISNVK